MTIKTVNKKITAAMNDLRLTEKEVDGILKAVKPDLSNGEGKAIASLYTRVTTPAIAPPGAVICFVPTAEAGAVEKLEKFIGDQRMPVGDTAVRLRDHINNFLRRVRLGPPSDKLPRSLNKLMALPLDENAPLGGATRTAYVDVAKKRYYLVETQALQNATPRVWGPLGLPRIEMAPAQKLNDARIEQIRGAWHHFTTVARFQFQPGGVMEHNIDKNWSSAELFRERHPDGHTYTAYVAVGKSTDPVNALKDPNTVREFYVERTGGIGGLTEHFGPVAIR